MNNSRQHQSEQRYRIGNGFSHDPTVHREAVASVSSHTPRRPMLNNYAQEHGHFTNNSPSTATISHAAAPYLLPRPPELPLPEATNAIVEQSTDIPLQQDAEKASGFSLAKLGKMANMTEIKRVVDRMGGLDGILTTVTKAQKIMTSVSQMAPLVKVFFGSFGSKNNNNNEHSSEQTALPAQRRRRRTASRPVQRSGSRVNQRPARRSSSYSSNRPLSIRNPQSSKSKPQTIARKRRTR
ncbi:hypothetical protein ACFSTH_00890 [Paenibacillus yanchengensis]|uniref:Tyrosine protein kinase n=1 Tax=Paenibacillus yanchengensis TaxID=2035833 RepID=A0ABW4YFF7_9BACL